MADWSKGNGDELNLTVKQCVGPKVEAPADFGLTKTKRVRQSHLDLS